MNRRNFLGACAVFAVCPLAMGQEKEKLRSIRKLVWTSPCYEGNYGEYLPCRMKDLRKKDVFMINLDGKWHYMVAKDNPKTINGVLGIECEEKNSLLL